MKDHQNGWPGLKAFAISAGVCSVDDNEDQCAEKIKAALPKKEKARGAVGTDKKPEA